MRILSTRVCVWKEISKLNNMCSMDLFLCNTSRRKIKKMITAATDGHPEPDSILKAQVKLKRELLAWRKIQFSLCPLLRHRLEALHPENLESKPLFLPSHMSQMLRSSYGMDRFGAIEYTLREGQAHDALESVRKAIRTFNYNLKFKLLQVHGQGPNMCAEGFLRTLTAEKLSCAEKYRFSHNALLSLGMTSDDPVFQELLDSQLWCKDSSKPLKLGDSKIEDPWYWTVGRPSGLSAEEEKDWVLESLLSEFSLQFQPADIDYLVDRVKWFRDHAACQRSREEKEILEEEFKRTIYSSEHWEKIWNELGRKEEAHSGGAVYTFQTAAMFGKLAFDCKEAFKKAKVKG